VNPEVHEGYAEMQKGNNLIQIKFLHIL